MEKRIFRNNYFDISFVTGLLFGAGYADNEEIAVFIGPILINIKTYAFNRKQKKRKSTI